MKFRVTMKDPDTLSDSITDAVSASLSDSDLSKAEKEAISEVRRDHCYDAAAEWFKYGEYLTVEIDTVLNTCVVIKPN